MRRLIGIMIVHLVASCAEGQQGDDGARFRADSEGFTCVPPSQWQARRDRGAVIFASADEPRHTIAVRSVPLTSERTASKVLTATDLVLRGLPGVQLDMPRELDGTLPSTEYRLTFAPPTSSERYQRRHFIVRGRKYVFHVIETAPSSTPVGEVASEFVSSMSEET